MRLDRATHPARVYAPVESTTVWMARCCASSARIGQHSLTDDYIKSSHCCRVNDLLLTALRAELGQPEPGVHFMRMFSSRIAGPAMAVALTVLGAGHGMSAALNILASGVRTGNQTGSAATSVQIAGAATSLSFKTTKAATPIYINYNAECGSIAPGNGWTSAVILVDGVAVPPTSTSRALCFADSSTTYHWVSAEVQALGSVAPGTHTVQVQVRPNNGATQWWVGDTSIIVGKF